MKNNFVVRKAAELLRKIRRAYTKGCGAARKATSLHETANRPPLTALRTAKLSSLIISYTHRVFFVRQSRPTYSKAVFVNISYTHRVSFVAANTPFVAAKLPSYTQSVSFMEAKPPFVQRSCFHSSSAAFINHFFFFP